MSKTCVTYPIVAALVKAEDMLDKNRKWCAKNATQERFLAEFFKVCRKEVTGIKDIESIASKSEKEINDFLKKRGFDIKLEKFKDDSSFGVASMLDVMLEWLKAGKESRVTNSNVNYPAVHLKGGTGVTIRKSLRHESPIACLSTKSGGLVYMTVFPDAPNNFDLVSKAEELSSAHNNYDYDGVVFPMVDLNDHADLSWIMNMETTNNLGNWYIAQAKQQSILKMNQFGARAKSAAAMEVTLRGAVMTSKPLLIIDQPFLMWITRHGLSKPLFVAHVTKEHWKNPGDITK